MKNIEYQRCGFGKQHRHLGQRSLVKVFITVMDHLIGQLHELLNRDSDCDSVGCTVAVYPYLHIRQTCCLLRLLPD